MNRGGDSLLWLAANVAASQVSTRAATPLRSLARGTAARCSPELSRCSRVSTVLFVVCFHFAGQFRLYGSS
jgi:hypothetical protein